MLKLMYITNNPEVAKIADEAGVDRIFIDLEQIGKQERQGGMDTVKSKHTIQDISRVKEQLKNAKLLVRTNPIHEESEKEIDQAIENGADILMLPFFKTVDEVRQFFSFVNGRVSTSLLVETPEAVEAIDEILELPEVEEVHIGLNDLHLGYKMKFMFELLADGTVEKLCTKFKEKGIRYGFGGIAALGQGMLPAEKIIVEHYRLESTQVILSRSFCNTEIINKLEEIQNIFSDGVKEIRGFEERLKNYSKEEFVKNKEEIRKIVKHIVADK